MIARCKRSVWVQFVSKCREYRAASNAVNVKASAFNVDQGDLKVDFRATQKDIISYRFTRAYQNNPATKLTGVAVPILIRRTPIYNTVGDWTRTITTSGQ